MKKERFSFKLGLMCEIVKHGGHVSKMVRSVDLSSYEFPPEAEERVHSLFREFAFGIGDK